MRDLKREREREREGERDENELPIATLEKENKSSCHSRQVSSLFDETGINSTPSIYLKFAPVVIPKYFRARKEQSKRRRKRESERERDEERASSSSWQHRM